MPSTHVAIDDALRAALLPDLELIRALGAGVSADVFLAREPALQRLVAVKVLRADLAEDRVGRQRFEREAQAAARIAHPHVTTVYRVGRTAEERPFIVMEYIEGRTLADMLAAHVPLDLALCTQVLTSVASALAAAHARGIIHRDLRPGNVMVENRTGRAVLGDFGIAALLESGTAAATRLTVAGSILGDTRYMSPEQARGEPVVEQSDVYAFGLVAFELLTGRSPYDARSDAELLIAHTRQEPRKLRELRPDVDAGLASIVHRCLAKEPNQRPLASEVAQLLEGGGNVSNNGPLGQFFGELRRRHVYQVLAAYTAVALGLFGIAQVVVDAFEMSQTAYKAFVAVTLAGFPLALILAWAYDMRAGRVLRTSSAETSRTTRILMWAGLAITLLLVGIIGWLLLGRGS